MDQQTRERLVGAAILIVIVVLLVPSLLTGGGRKAEFAPVEPATGVRSIEVQVAPAAQPEDEDDRLMPEPASAGGASLSLEPDPVVPVPPVVEDAATPAGDRPAAVADMPAPAPTVSAPVAAGGTPAWAVQLGAFSTRSAADRLVAELKGKGYAAFVLEYRGSAGLLYRVRVGPEEDRARADAVAERLKKAGFKPIVGPHP